MDARVLVPIKAFRAAKARLAPALTDVERSVLARAMAAEVVRAAAPLPVAVACDDEDVAAWARAAGADVVWTPGLGLNGAVQHGFATLIADGADLVVVAHGDLPRARELARFDDGFGGVTLVPDRRDDGTNVVAVPAPHAGFTFAYGIGSFARHTAEAERVGAALRVVRAPELQWDVDTPRDLLAPRT